MLISKAADIEKQLHSESVAVWAVLSVDSVVEALFFEGGEGNVNTVNKEKFILALKRKGTNIKTSGLNKM